MLQPTGKDQRKSRFRSMDDRDADSGKNFSTLAELQEWLVQI
ncbi:MAG TPA: hypothetical protein V6D18_02400 [Thermosynechococcaceae cyanobacterium]